MEDGRPRPCGEQAPQDLETVLRSRLWSAVSKARASCSTPRRNSRASTAANPSTMPVAPRTAVGIAAQRNHFDIVLRRSLRPPARRGFRLAASPLSAIRLRPREFPATRPAVRERDSSNTDKPFRIELAHAPDVPRKVSFADEVAENGLIDQRRMMRADRFRRGKNVHHVGRNHQICQAKSREEHVGETAGEDHHARPIQTLQRGDRPSRSSDIRCRSRPQK